MNSEATQFELPEDILDLDPDIHKKINEGDSFAQLNLGQIYVSKDDYEKAFYWLKLAAKQGNMKAQFILGDFYDNGKGVKKDELIAYEWYTKAAIQGYPKALTRLHNLYYTEERMFTPETTSNEQGHIRELFEKTAEKYNTDILHRFVLIHQSSSDVKSDQIKTPTCYKSASEELNIEAQFILETLFEKGKNDAMHYLDALKWLTLAASQHSDDTQFSVSSTTTTTTTSTGANDLFYCKWLHVLSNLINSAEYIEWHDDSFWGALHYQLGYMFYHGYGTPIDYKKAWDSFKVSGTQYNETRAMDLLTIESKDIDISMKKEFLKKLQMMEAVIEYLQKEELYELGVIYFHGVYAKVDDTRHLIIESDHAKASEYFRMITRKHLIDAEEYYGASSYYLGMIHYVNAKHKQVISKAPYYLNNAANCGYTDAAYILESINDPTNTEGFQKVVKWHLKNQGSQNLNLLYNIARMYDEGIGVNRDYKEAAKYYEIVAEEEYTVAYCRLGRMYYQGYGVEKNYITAIKWYKKAAKQNNVVASYNLGDIYYNGQDVNYAEAFKFYTVAAKRGYIDAQFQLGCMYRYGHGVEIDYITSVKWYKRAAEQNHTLANFNLGELYYLGKSIEKDIDEALKHYITAAEQGHSDSQFQVGYVYEIKEDYAEAARWYKKATQQGNYVATYNLAVMYFYGRGVEIDYKESAKHYEIAAETGDVDAQFKLGYMYNLGYGVKKNFTAAIKWYKRAAEQNVVVANYNLGMMYFYGEGTDKDYVEAFKYYKITADRGHNGAVFQTGYCYFRGFGIDKDEDLGLQLMLEVSDKDDYKLCVLGAAYHSTNSINQNFSKALEFYQMVPDSGNTSYALRGIGLLYEYGDGVEQSYNEALKYYNQAAELNNTGAYYNLALLYYYGNGVDKDYEVALEWFYNITFQEMEDGNMYVCVKTKNEDTNEVNQDKQKEYSWEFENFIYGEAHYYLSVMYAKGQGTVVDHEKSAENLKLAISYGYKNVNK